MYTSGIPYGSEDNNPGTDTKLSSKPGWRHGSPGGTPPSQRKIKGLSLGSRFAGDDDAVCDSLSEMSVSTTSTEVSKETFEGRLSHNSPSQPYSPHRELDISKNYSSAIHDERSEEGPSESAPPIPPRNHASFERSESEPVHSSRTEELLEGGCATSTVGKAGIELESSVNAWRGSSLPAKVTYVGIEDDEIAGSKKRSDTIEKPATHHDEYWYMPGIPRYDEIH